MFFKVLWNTLFIERNSYNVLLIFISSNNLWYRKTCVTWQLCNLFQYVIWQWCPFPIKDLHCVIWHCLLNTRFLSYCRMRQASVFYILLVEWGMVWLTVVCFWTGNREALPTTAGVGGGEHGSPPERLHFQGNHRVLRQVSLKRRRKRWARPAVSGSLLVYCGAYVEVWVIRPSYTSSGW